MFVDFIIFLRALGYYFRYDILSMGTDLMNLVGCAGFYVALFLFSASYSVPVTATATAPVVENNPVSATPIANPEYIAPVTLDVDPQPVTMSTEEKLIFLKDQLEKGIISKEVYDAQVAETIAQL